MKDLTFTRILEKDVGIIEILDFRLINVESIQAPPTCITVSANDVRDAKEKKSGNIWIALS